ncbi:hypothetical protein ACFLQ2_05735 [archaeon]
MAIGKKIVKPKKLLKVEEGGSGGFGIVPEFGKTRSIPELQNKITKFQNLTKTIKAKPITTKTLDELAPSENKPTPLWKERVFGNIKEEKLGAKLFLKEKELEKPLSRDVLKNFHAIIRGESTGITLSEEDMQRGVKQHIEKIFLRDGEYHAKLKGKKFLAKLEDAKVGLDTVSNSFKIRLGDNEYDIGMSQIDHATVIGEMPLVPASEKRPLEPQRILHDKTGDPGVEANSGLLGRVELRTGETGDSLPEGSPLELHLSEGIVLFTLGMDKKGRPIAVPAGKAST